MVAIPLVRVLTMTAWAQWIKTVFAKLAKALKLTAPDILVK
jgi:hypothetical protein